MSNRVFSSTVLALTVGFALGLADLTVLARQEPSTQNTKQTSRSKSGTTTTKKSNDTTATSTATGDATNQEMTPAPPQSETRKGRKRAAAPETATVATIQTEQTDLTGTYAGTFNCDEIGLTGDTTLTITGNQFTTADGKNGRIVASTTKGYTAVALQLGDTAAAIPTIVSLRGRKTGDKLTLTPVDAAHPCSFTPARVVASRRGRRATQSTPAPAATEVASPAEAGPSPADVTAPATPKRKTRKGAARPAALPTTAPSVMPKPPATESPAPVPVPVQNPSPSPSPSPAPRPSPTSSPTPEATPSPSPLPSPSPAPKRP